MDSKRKDYITLLSVISAISVVFLHTNGCFWVFSKARYWFTANIIECVFFFAVPIFFMITGANLIDYQKKYSTKEYFKKRINKVFIPYICWSLIGLLYLIQKKTVAFQSVDFNYLFNGLFNNTIIGIYWFFLPLFCIYLCIPLFASVEESKRKTVFSYLAIAAFILESLIPFIISVFHLKIGFSISISVCSSYLLFVIVGYLLDKYDLKTYMRIIIYILGIIGLLMHIIGTYKLSMDANEIVKTYKGYCNVPSVLYSISIFVFIKELCKKIKVGKIVNSISKYTFAIYLIHWYILDIIVRITKVDTGSIFYRLGAPFIIIPICILIAYIIRKIPILKRIVP